MNVKLNALHVAAKKYTSTLDAHRANPKDAELVEAWDKATSELDVLIKNNELDIVASLIAALEQSEKQRESWKQIAQTNLSEREKDISELDAARKRIAELESSQLAVKLPDLKKLSRELVENLVDCASADGESVSQYLEWTEKTIRAAGITVQGGE